MDLCDSDINELIRVACNFVFANYGSNPKLEQRSEIVQALHDQFPQLDYNVIKKKMRQRVSNVQRPPKEKSVRNKAKTIASEGNTDDNVVQVNSEENDYDCLLKGYNISKVKVREGDEPEYVYEYLDENSDKNESKQSDDEYDVG